MIGWEHSSAKLASRNEDGFILVQPEPYGSEGTLPNYEVFLHGGVVFRPKDPTDELAANVLTFRDGPEGRVVVGHDPRWMSVLPDFGDGGAALYGTTELDGAKKAPYFAVFGSGGEATEGLVRISVPSSAGTTTVEIDPSSGDFTVTHPGGTSVTVKGTEVLLGGTGGSAVVVDNGALAAWASAVTAALGSLSQPVTPLSGYTATKVKAV